jgi:hypothetical protein
LRAANGPAYAGREDVFKRKGSAQKQRKQGVAQIPVCSKKLASIAVIGPEDAVQWWTRQQLPAASKLIKFFVSRAKGFSLVDRGAHLSAGQYERELAASGELRNNSTIGKGQ